MGLVRAKIERRAPTHDRVALERNLRDGDESTRFASARALGDDRSAVDVLVDALEGEQTASVREAIVTSLARIATSEAARGLARFLGAEDVFLRNVVIEGLARMPAAAAELPALFDSEDPDVRIFASVVAGRIGGTAARDVLLARLEMEPHVNALAAAIEALAQVGAPDTAAAVERCANRWPDEPYVSFAAQACCERLASR